MLKQPAQNFTTKLSWVKGIRPVYLLVAASLSCLICINALRMNNLHMVKLRTAVYAADKDNGDVSKALTDLQRYVTSHMNTDLTPGKNAVHPPIQLKYTYDRLLAVQNQQLGNDKIYNDAQKHCESLNNSDFSGRNRVPCIQEYVTTHGVRPTQSIPDSLYKFDFISPLWSPDLAGWSAIATFLLLVAALVLWLVRRFRR